MTECQQCHKEGKIDLTWGVIGMMKFICPECNVKRIPNEVKQE